MSVAWACQVSYCHRQHCAVLINARLLCHQSSLCRCLLYCTGSTVILIDNLHIPTFERRGGPSWPPAEVRLRNLYISGNDYLSVTKFVRIKAPGFSAIPKTNCNHVNGVISALLMYLKVGKRVGGCTVIGSCQAQ